MAATDTKIAVKAESVPTDDPEVKVIDTSKTATFSELFENAEPYDYFLMFMGTLGGFGTGLSLPFFNVIFGKMLDALNDKPGSFSERINGIALIFVWVAIGNLFTGALQVSCWSIAGERISQKLREKYVRAILSQEIGWFDTCGAGELATRVADLSGKVQDGLGRKVGDLCQYFAQVVGSFLVGFYLCWKLTLVLLAAFPCIAGAGAFMIVAITSAQNQGLEQYAAAGGLASESLGAIRTVTALNAQPSVINRYRDFLFTAMRVGIVKGFKVGLGNGGVFGACFLTYALGFWYGGKLVADALQDGCFYGKYADGRTCPSGGDIMAVFFAVIMGSIALGQLAPPLAAFIAAKAAVAPMMDIIKRVPLIDGLSDEGLKPDKKPTGLIEIKDVEFAYPSRPNITVCKGYSLSVAAGETIALVGASGSGKSTVINLLLRFYDPNSGSVSLDGMDIRTLNVRWLRAQIGYVGQEPVLFSGSVADNIAYGLDTSLLSSAVDKAAIREQVIAAAQQANAHDFISKFPQGYDTDVGSGGVAMSGGQKQRIAIARALIKKPSVLLLDEATSALDAVSERIVQATLAKLQTSKAQTTVVVAHRLSTIRSADKIAVVNEGIIAELGNHTELLAKNGLYADLVRLQMTGDEDESSKSSDNLAALVEETQQLVEAVAATATAEVTGSTSGEVVKAADKEAEEEISKDESVRLTKRVWDLVLQHKLWFFAALFGGAAFGSVFPVWGLLLANTQEMFYLTSVEKIRLKAARLAGWYVLMAVVSIVSSMLQFGGVAQVGERVTLKLRSMMFEAIMRREITFFDDEKNSTGELATRLSDDSRTVNKATGETLARQIQAMFTLAIGLGLGLSASWRIALVVLSTFPLSIAASAVQMQAIAGQQYDTNDGSGGGHGGIISSAFTHMRTVSAFSVQFRVADIYAQLTKKISDDRASRSVTAGLGFGGAQTSLFLTYALLFWYGSTLIKKGDVDFKNMMQSILCLMLGALGLGQALADLGDQKAGLAAARRIFKAVEDGELSPIDGLSQEGIKPEKRPTGRIELKNVNFAYPTRPDVQVCKDYNLTIESGEVVALVGPSGSGKSTIMNLLLRFYDPLSGSVTLDGIDTRELNVRWLRAQIGYVGQEPVLFQGSVASNIAKGRPDVVDESVVPLSEAITLADKSTTVCGCTKSSYDAVPAGDIEMVGEGAADADIIDACKASNAHDFIMAFPKKYATDVGEGSIMVSGGQKQRIAIARALIKKPAVLLLDEATSALDAASERLVQESIDMLQASKIQTTIVIAHRLTTIMGADKIVVVDKGQVVETGKHDELIAKEGLYAELWAKQQGVTVASLRSSKSGGDLASAAPGVAGLLAGVLPKF